MEAPPVRHRVRRAHFPPPRPTGAPAAAACAAPGPVGGTNGPSGTDSTFVNVTFGRLSDLRFSHGVWPNAVKSAPENVRVRIVRIIMDREASL